MEVVSHDWSGMQSAATSSDEGRRASWRRKGPRCERLLRKSVAINNSTEINQIDDGDGDGSGDDDDDGGINTSQVSNRGVRH